MAAKNTDELTEELSQDPQDWDLRLRLAEALVMENQNGQAITVLDAGEDPPEFETQIMKLAELYARIAPGKAVPIIHAFLEQRPESAMGHMAMAEVAAKVGDKASAGDYYRRAVALNPARRDADFESRFGIDFQETVIPPLSTADPEPLPEPEIPASAPDPAPSAAESEKAVDEEPKPAAKSGRARKKKESNPLGCAISIVFAIATFLLGWLIFLLVVKQMWAS